MIPQTYFYAPHNKTYSVLIIEVKPHWSCYPFASHRCLIGEWNFECTRFIDVVQANGKSPWLAYSNAVKNFDQLENEPMNEDRQMLGE